MNNPLASVAAPALETLCPAPWAWCPVIPWGMGPEDCTNCDSLAEAVEAAAAWVRTSVISFGQSEDTYALLFVGPVGEGEYPDAVEAEFAVEWCEEEGDVILHASGHWGRECLAHVLPRYRLGSHEAAGGERSYFVQCARTGRSLASGSLATVRETVDTLRADGWTRWSCR